MGTEETSVSLNLKDKILGVVVSLAITVIGFLVFSYFSSFVGRAEYNKDKAEIEVIKADITYIKKSVDRIEDKLNH